MSRLRHVSEALLKDLYLVLPRGIENSISGKELQLSLARRGHSNVSLRIIKYACRQLVFRGIPCGGVPGEREGYFVAETQVGYERLRSIPESQALSGLSRVEALDRAWRYKFSLNLPLELPKTAVKGVVSASAQNIKGMVDLEDCCQPTPIISRDNMVSEWTHDLLLAVGKSIFIQSKTLDEIREVYGVLPMMVSRFVRKYGRAFGLRLWHRGPRGAGEKIDRAMYGRWKQAVDAWTLAKLKKLLPADVAEGVMRTTKEPT